MKYLFLLLLSISLSGCVILLPVSGDTISGVELQSEETLDANLGKSLDEIREQFSHYPHWEITSNNRTYLVFHSTQEFGLWAIIIASPGGGGGVGTGGYLGEATDCYRLVFADQQFDTYEIEDFSLKSANSPETETELDCRNAFWLPEELQEIRSAQKEQAAEGDRAAAIHLARGFGDTDPAKMLAIRDQDVELATILMHEFGEFDALSQLASESTDLERANELMKVIHASPADLNEVIRVGELGELAADGDPDDLLQAYYSETDDQPLYWLCLAADRGSEIARYRLGELYFFGQAELERNLILSYMWHRLAAMIDSVGSMKAVKIVASTLNSDELMLAEKLVQSWKPGQCYTAIEASRNSP